MNSPMPPKKWQYASDTPDRVFLATTDKQAKLLPTVKAGYTHPVMEGCQCFITGSWRIVFTFLRTRLEEDYAALQKDAMTEKLPFLFHYVLMREDEVLLNMTRLYSLYHSGTIMYGDYIIRTGPDVFQLWAKKQQEQPEGGS